MPRGGENRSVSRPTRKNAGGAGARPVLHAAIEALEDRRMMSVGGGLANAGLTGDYFDNTTLSGSPSFTRQDNRIDFRWQNAGPGGSGGSGFTDVPAHNFSSRWTGQVLARFSENYTFITTSDAGARFFIKPAGASTWTTLIDHWSAHAAATDSAAYGMTAGQAYDVKLEYWDDNSAGAVKLEWSSGSTPRELIEPAGSAGINVYNDGFADRMKTARDEWSGYDGANNRFTGSNAPRDANGWPMSDAAITVWEGVDQNEGTYLLQFNGRARVDIQFGAATVSNLRYDPESNTSIGDVVVASGKQNFTMVFKNTRRTVDSALNTGVTNVKLMRPTVVGGDTPYPVTTTFAGDYLAALGRYTTLRTMTGTNWNNSVDWADRTLPGYSTQHFTRPDESGFETNGMAWEYRVELANETGKDLYINIPETASDAYITKLAQLIKYGSDGVNPYTSTQADPIYAPLNSNLRLYVEYSNEVWNFGFAQWAQNYDAAQTAVANKTADGNILSFDGTSNTNVLANRRQALRTVQASNLFRAVFGNADLGSRIRPVLEWQYDNAGFPATAQTQLDFINNYFNNGDGGQHVASPHPVSYYLWGGGGANYYDAVNSSGETSLLTGGGFETPAVSNYQPNLASGDWKFSGPAGIAANGSSLGNPDAPEGTQAAYLQGIGGNNGQVSINFTFPASGVSNVYALSFQAAQRSDSNHQSFDVLVDGVSIANGNTGPNWYQPGNDWSSYVTNIFHADASTQHTISFVGESGTGDQTALIDNVKLTSADGLFAADVPATRNNNTATVSTASYQGLLNTEVNWARLYGLHEVAYEGGWALGGDFGGTPLQNWAKFNDPRAGTTEHAAIDMFNQSGGDLNIRGTYTQWTDSPSAAFQPLPAGVDASNTTLRAEATNGTSASTPLTQANRTLDNNDNGGSLFAQGWIDWNVLIPATGNYEISATTAAGGAAQLTADDITLLASGISGSVLGGTTFFTQGLHTVRIKCTSGSFAVSQVVLTGAQSGNLPPTVAAPAAASSSKVTGTTTDLSVLGADNGGEANLTYTWSMTQSPADVSFSANAANDAKNTTATFSALGNYRFLVTISDGSLTTTSSVSVVVAQGVASIFLSPQGISLPQGATQQFSATALDQFGNRFDSPPPFTWSVISGSGDISPLGEYTAPGIAGSFTLQAASGSAFGTVDGTVTDIVAAASIAGRYIYYNHSYWNDSAFGRTDDTAIDESKTALRPGRTATFANYTGSLRGINGIMVDIANLPSDTLSTDDFSFRVGNDSSPDRWTDVPTAPTITVRREMGTNGSDRVEITWDDNAIQNTWLQVTVNATASTGLLDSDVFYFGNQIGETGNNPGDTFVDASDMVAIRDHITPFGTHAAASNRFDLNHDGFADASDMVVVRDHVNDPFNRLRLITPPLPPAPAAPAAAATFAASSAMASEEPASVSPVAPSAIVPPPTPPSSTAPEVAPPAASPVISTPGDMTAKPLAPLTPLPKIASVMKTARRHRVPVKSVAASVNSSGHRHLRTRTHLS